MYMLLGSIFGGFFMVIGSITVVVCVGEYITMWVCGRCECVVVAECSVYCARLCRSRNCEFCWLLVLIVVIAVPE